MTIHKAAKQWEICINVIKLIAPEQVSKAEARKDEIIIIISNIQLKSLHLFWKGTWTAILL